MLARWNPYGEISALQREVQNLFDRTWGRAGREPTSFGSFIPPTDIRETKNEYVVHMDLPGIDQKDVHVGMENDVLTVRGERRSEEEKKDECLSCSERAYGTFVRSFSLPGTADAEKITAAYKNGVLTVTIPKREEAKPRSIKVEVN
jgi:HSP20 family protein